MERVFKIKRNKPYVTYFRDDDDDDDDDNDDKTKMYETQS
jgi:hypothetical protein